jgi:hypothetical protein
MGMNEKRIQQYVSELSELAKREVTNPVCPLCLQERAPEELTAGHIIPRALGGKRKTLTCKFCDNTLGHRLEAAVINFLLNPEIIEGKRPGRPSPGIRTWIEHKGRTVYIHIQGNEARGVSFWAVRPDDQTVLDEYVAGLKGWPEIHHDLPKGLTDPFVAHMIVRVAYLAAFEECGYGYLFRRSVKRVREFVQSAPGTLSLPETVWASPNSEIFHWLHAHGIQTDSESVIICVQFKGMSFPLVASRLGFAVLPPLDSLEGVAFPQWRDGLRVRLRREESEPIGVLHLEFDDP